MARQNTAMETAHWGRADEGPAGAAVLVQGANRGGSDGAHGWPGHGYGSLGGKAFGIMTENEARPPPPPPPPPLNKALRKPKSLWASFAIIAKSCQQLDSPANKTN